MEARTWARAKSLLADAAELPAADQRQYIEQHCSDPALRAELLAMLATPAPLSAILSQPTLRPGTVLGNYRIEEMLGSGGMGEVYRARDTRLMRDVAIKVLPSDISEDPNRVRRFEREAQTLALVSHPHIAAIYAFEHMEGVAFLVMEFVDGITLAERLAKGRLQLTQAFAIAKQIAEALAAAHRAGIIHRDLKPGNLMLAKGGVKLLDFGLAKAARAAVADQGSPPAGTAPLTNPGVMLGTLPYMAPEQIAGHADARTDLFAFGCILYEMLAGTPPFGGTTTASLLAGILERDPTPLSSLVPTLPPAVVRVVDRCLAKDPDTRWQTATDLLAELVWALNPGANVPRARAQYRRLIAWVVIAACIAVLVSTFFTLRLTRRAEPPAMRFVLQPPPGEEFAGNVAFSHDGRRIAYSTVPDTDNRTFLSSTLWVYSFEDGNSSRVPNSKGAYWPFFSPDGRYLGFCANFENLEAVDLSNGKANVLATGGCAEAEWTETGSIAFVQRGAIYEVPETGGTAALVLPRRMDVGFEMPQLLPDRRHFLLNAELSGSNSSGIYIGDGRTHATTMLRAGGVSARYARPGYLVYGQNWPSTFGLTLVAQPFDSTRLALTGTPTPIAQRVDGFGVSPQGVLAYFETGSTTSNLAWIGRDGTPLGLIEPPEGMSALHPRLSFDGQRVAYDAVDASGDRRAGIWVQDLVRKMATRVTSGDEVRPVWSPDDKELVFMRFDGRLVRKSTTGGGEVHELLQAPGVYPIVWSSDGRELIYGDVDGSLYVWRGANQTKLLTTAFGNYGASLSSDRRWLAYTTRGPKHLEIYVTSYPDFVRQWRISTDGGAQPLWRQDGRELFYIAPDKRLMSVTVTPHDGELQFGTPTALFASNVIDAYDMTYDVTADGRRFIMCTVKQKATPTPLQIVANWPSLLKQ
jgi:serine/threonine protein kinase/WD40 repeat protein